MKVEVELIPAQEKILRRWASVGRTFDETTRVIDEMFKHLTACKEGRLHITQEEFETLAERVAYNELERTDLHAPLENLHLAYRTALWAKNAELPSGTRDYAQKT